MYEYFLSTSLLYIDYNPPTGIIFKRTQNQRVSIVIL